MMKIKYETYQNIKTSLFGLLIFMSTSLNIYGQNKLLQPSISHFVTTDIISHQPTGIYIHKAADFYGIEISLSQGSYPVGSNVSSSNIKKSIKEIILDFRERYPLSKLFYLDEKINKLELSDTLHTDFIKFDYSSYPIKLLWFHPIDTSKTEAELISKFNDLIKKVKSISIPTVIIDNKTYFTFTIGVNPIPILGITSIEKYDNELIDKLISKLSLIKDRLEREQIYETNLPTDLSITKASLFSLFLSKNFALKLISK